MRALVLALLLITGCSWIGVRVPNHPPSGVALKCSTAAPAIDTGMGVVGLGFGLTVAAVDMSTESYYQGVATVIIGLPALLVGALYTGSAGYGWRARGRCERVVAAPPIEYAISHAARAEEFAARGDCSLALAFGRRVFDYDPDYYRNVFLHRPGMQDCFSASRNARTQEEVKRVAVERAQKTRDREQAMALVKQARDAAEASDCEKANALGVPIQALDADAYDVRYLKDPAIAKCLGP